MVSIAAQWRACLRACKAKLWAIGAKQFPWRFCSAHIGQGKNHQIPWMQLEPSREMEIKSYKNLQMLSHTKTCKCSKTKTNKLEKQNRAKYVRWKETCTINKQTLNKKHLAQQEPRTSLTLTKYYQVWWLWSAFAQWTWGSFFYGCCFFVLGNPNVSLNKYPASTAKWFGKAWDHQWTELPVYWQGVMITPMPLCGDRKTTDPLVN